MIEIKNVAFGYNSYHNVLKDFSLSFKEGGVYGLLGKNGTGKSTLLYLIAGLLHPRNGEVLVDGVPSQQRLPETMQDLFIVPEEYDLPRIPLRQYVESLKPFYPRFSEELLDRCLRGFDMTMDINLAALSMGQKKKAYMCIALATNTRYLLMDEPTNGLDILSKSQFRKVVIGGMSEDKTIIISTHQVHDVEHMLDHVCIIDQNRVLLDAPLTEDNGPVDLEKLFIDVESGNYVPTYHVEEERTMASVEPMVYGKSAVRSWWDTFLSVGKWDVTLNRKFYLRQIVVLAGCVLVPIIFKYLMLMGKFHLFNAAGVGAMMAAEEDIVASSYYFCFIFAIIMLQSFCYMFHNLTTKQGRICELTLPADNCTKFLWHVTYAAFGTMAAFFLSVLLADIIHVILGWITLGQTHFKSITLATWTAISNMSLVGTDMNFSFKFFCILASVNYLSTFALGSAYKYRHTFGFVLLFHIALWLSAIFMLGLLGNILVGVIELVDSLAFFKFFVLFCSTAVFAAIWWFTYRLYCNAQITSKRNP